MRTSHGLMSLLATGMLTAAVQAVPVFSDNFASGITGYYRFGTTNTTLAWDNANEELDFTVLNGALARSGVVRSFTEQTLANVGDKLVLSFKISNRKLNTGENHAFRFAIGNAGNPTAVPDFPVTQDLTSNTPMASGTRLFYQFSASTSATAGFNQFVSDTSSPVHNVGGTLTAIGGLAGIASVVNQSDTPLPVTLTLTRTASGLDIEKNWDGNISTGSYSATDFIFNTIAFSMNNAPAAGVTIRFALDDVSVEYIPVPEPTSLGVLGLAGLALGRRRRSS